MTRIIFLIFTLTLISCDFMVPQPATKEQKQEVMRNALFDKSIIQNLDKFNNLITFLENNLDTITKYRYSKNTATLIRGQGQSDSNYLADDECYNFFQGSSRYDISNVPDFLKKTLDSLFHTFTENEIKSFVVCKNKTLLVEVRSEGGENGMYISHNLLWNSKIERDYAYSDNKDSLIGKNCIYRIGLIEHHGH